MNGLQFFQRYSRLKLAARWTVRGDGVCPSCDRPDVTLFDAGGTAVCDGCALLRQSYPYPDKAIGLRLSKGDFALLTPDRAIFWVKHLLREIDATIEVRPHRAWASDLATILRTPPDGEWLLIGFERSPSGRTLFVNRSADYLQVSGTVVVGGRRRLRAADLRWVRMAAAAFPALTTTDWRVVFHGRCAERIERAARSQRADRDIPKAERKTAYAKLCEAHPDLGTYPLPPLASGENLALEIITDAAAAPRTASHADADAAGVADAAV